MLCSRTRDDQRLVHRLEQWSGEKPAGIHWGFRHWIASSFGDCGEGPLSAHYADVTSGHYTVLISSADDLASALCLTPLELLRQYLGNGIDTNLALSVWRMPADARLLRTYKQT